MAHELTTRENGFTEMAFVGETPWHGLGQQLTHDSTIEEWQVASGMDWTIEQTPVCFNPSHFDEDAEKMVNDGVDSDSKSLGAYYILGALTLVNVNTAISLPWLFQSVSHF